MPDPTEITDHVLRQFLRDLRARPEFAEAFNSYPESRNSTPRPDGGLANVRAWRAGVQAAAHVQRLMKGRTP